MFRSCFCGPAEQASLGKSAKLLGIFKLFPPFCLLPGAVQLFWLLWQHGPTLWGWLPAGTWLLFTLRCSDAHTDHRPGQPVHMTAVIYRVKKHKPSSDLQQWWQSCLGACLLCWADCQPSWTQVKKLKGSRTGLGAYASFLSAESTHEKGGSLCRVGCTTLCWLACFGARQGWDSPTVLPYKAGCLLCWR